MHIRGMQLGGVPPFTERVEFDFHMRVNVFIGPNAAGKSTLLRVARKFLLADFSKNAERDELDEYEDCKVRYSDDWPYVRDRDLSSVPPDLVENAEEDRRIYGDWHDWESVPIISVPAARVGANMQTEQRQPEVFYWSTAWMYSGESDRAEGPQSVTVAQMLQPDHMQGWDVFYAEMVQHVIDLMENSDRVQSDWKAQVNLLRAIGTTQDCAAVICRETIVAGDLPDHRIVTLHDDEGPSSGERDVTQHYFRVRVHGSDYPLTMYALSSGTEVTIWWIRFVALFMLHHYDYKDGWENESAILLVDEIENHLHPTWQRRVIPALLERFPGLQIFATTHSPFVVAGLKAGQVHLLNRDADGVVTASTNQEDIEGWTSDEILRVYMGVDDPTDKTTAEAAAQLRRMRDEEPRVDELEEGQRQAEMRRLRQIVDRSELSGPRAAEDARFLADLRSILHRHSQSQNLNQENG